MKVDLAPGWKTELDRGPDWLFVKLYGPNGDEADAKGMANSLYLMMEQEFKGRLLLELEHLYDIPQDFVDELIQLREKMEKQGNTLRLCGMAAEHQSVLQQHDPILYHTHYHDREEAVLGYYRPGKPR